ncbi:MAG: hypothetical protein FWF10_02585 [Clostridiales bacterium]|nr:hypothetical protein [Clostridiales bacterium]
MYCGKCGVQNPDDNSFCGACGQRLSKPGPAPTAPPARTPAPAHTSASNEYYEEAPAYRPAPRSTRPAPAPVEEYYEDEPAPRPARPARPAPAPVEEYYEDEPAPRPARPAPATPPPEVGTTRLAHKEYVPRPRPYTRPVTAAEAQEAWTQPAPEPERPARLRVSEQETPPYASPIAVAPLPARMPEPDEYEDEELAPPPRRIHRREEPGLVDARPAPRRAVLPEPEDEEDEEIPVPPRREAPPAAREEIPPPPPRQTPRFSSGPPARRPAPTRPVEPEYEDDEDDLFDEPAPPPRSAPGRNMSAPPNDARADDTERSEPPRDERRRPAPTPAPIYDDEEDDSYGENEYDPTTPREKKEGGSAIVWILLTAGIIVLAALAAIVGYGNCTNAEWLPDFLQFSRVESPGNNNTDDPNFPPPIDTPNPGNNGTVMTDRPSVRAGEKDGKPAMYITVQMSQGEVATFSFPNGNTHVFTAQESGTMAYEFPYTYDYFYPDTPLDSSIYMVEASLSISDAEGNFLRAFDLDPFSLTFSPITLELTKPTQDEIAAGLMADQTNTIRIEGVVNHETDVTVTVNGQSLPVYQGGIFQGDYKLTGDDSSEQLIIRVEKDNYVTSTQELFVNTYVYVPKPMVLEVNDSPTAMRVTGNKITVTGSTIAGATLTAKSDISAVACGSVTVDATGVFSFEVTFMDAKFTGFANVSIEASMEGHETKTRICMPFFPGKDRQDFVKRLGKTGYFELGIDNFTIDKLLADTDRTHGFRIGVNILEVVQDGRVQILKVETTGANKTTMYVYNFVKDYVFSGRGTFNLYGQLNGLYGDTENYVFIAYFQVKK